MRMRFGELADAVDTPDPLFDAHGIPGHVVVYEYSACLEVQALARRLGTEEDLQVVAGLEVALDLLLAHVQPGEAIPYLTATTAVAGDL